MKIIFSLFFFLVLILCEYNILRFKDGAEVNIPVSSNIISILSPSLHQEALAQRSSFYCHCHLDEWVAFMKLALQDGSEVNLQVNETIKKVFCELKARISAHASDKNTLIQILARQGPSTRRFVPSTLVQVWFLEFRMILKILPFQEPPDSPNSTLQAYRISNRSQLYIAYPFTSFRNLHIEYFRILKNDNITLKPQAIFEFQSNFQGHKCLIGPVDSAFNADLVDLQLADLHEFFLRIEWLNIFFKDRTIPRESARIERYLFLHQRRIRIAIPLLFRDQFPFKNPFEILNQLIVLLPRYKLMIESCKIRIYNNYEALVRNGNHLHRAAMNERHSIYLVDLFETFCQDLIHTMLENSQNNPNPLLSPVNRSNLINRRPIVNNQETPIGQDSYLMDIQIQEVPDLDAKNDHKIQLNAKAYQQSQQNADQNVPVQI